MNKDNKPCTNDNSFEYGKTYYFDRSGLTIKEAEIKALHAGCKSIIETCSRLQLPKGFKFSECTPGMCFDLSGLSCVKSPVVQKVTLPTCERRHSIECEVIAGYEIRAVGDVNFSVSSPVCPIKGSCFPVQSHTCSSISAPVNKVISYTCCPKPCDPCTQCIDWAFAFFSVCPVEDACGIYLQVKLGVALEYTGDCENEEE